MRELIFWGVDRLLTHQLTSNRSKFDPKSQLPRFQNIKAGRCYSVIQTQNVRFAIKLTRRTKLLLGREGAKLPELFRNPAERIMWLIVMCWLSHPWSLSHQAYEFLKFILNCKWICSLVSICSGCMLFCTSLHEGKIDPIMSGHTGESTYFTPHIVPSWQFPITKPLQPWTRLKWGSCFCRPGQHLAMFSKY